MSTPDNIITALNPGIPIAQSNTNSKPLAADPALAVDNAQRNTPQPKGGVEEEKKQAQAKESMIANNLAEVAKGIKDEFLKNFMEIIAQLQQSSEELASTLQGVAETHMNKGAKAATHKASARAEMLSSGVSAIKSSVSSGIDQMKKYLYSKEEDNLNEDGSIETAAMQSLASGSSPLLSVVEQLRGFQPQSHKPSSSQSYLSLHDEEEQTSVFNKN
jgi:hypothetical protein